MVDITPPPTPPLDGEGGSKRRRFCSLFQGRMGSVRPKQRDRLGGVADVVARQPIEHGIDEAADEVGQHAAQAAAGSVRRRSAPPAPSRDRGQASRGNSGRAAPLCGCGFAYRRDYRGDGRRRASLFGLLVAADERQCAGLASERAEIMDKCILAPVRDPDFFGARLHDGLDQFRPIDVIGDDERQLDAELARPARARASSHSQRH